MPTFGPLQRDFSFHPPATVGGFFVSRERETAMIRLLIFIFVICCMSRGFSDYEAEQARLRAASGTND